MLYRKTNIRNAAYQKNVEYIVHDRKDFQNLGKQKIKKAYIEFILS